MCLCLIGMVHRNSISAKEEQVAVLEEIQEISMTKEQFDLVEYYRMPQMQLKAVTKNIYDSNYGFSLLSDA